ncbi:MAG: DUF4394 domain-containing protein [Synechococcales bacterium]|nr:DUF4394 domain-containing protein [Synechococcales bacterium]
MQFLTALTDNNTLITFDLENPAEASSVTVTGINGTLLGIDIRPANGLIYGLTTANQLYTLDPNGFDAGEFNGNFTLTHEEETQLLDDALYINLHTENFKGGELRGQLDVELEHDIVAFDLPIEESQQVGDTTPPDGPAIGMFNVIYDDATNTLNISGTFSDLTSDLLPVGDVDAEGNPQSAIHLHNGMAGENGPIVRNFSVDESGQFEGTFTLTDAEEMLLLDQALYVNLHTETFNGGELRGQVSVETEGDIVDFGVAIEESQQAGDVVPPNGPATGAFDLIYDNSTNQLVIDGEFDDLTSPLFPVGPAADGEGNPQSAVHLHNGMAGENGPIIRNLMTTDNVATLVSTLSQSFEGGLISGFDFNPVADRLRLVGDNDQNFRINVDTGEVIADGTLAFGDGDSNEGMNPNITAAAYTNSVAAPTSTALYDIDPLLDTLLLQNPPNDGTLVTVGDLGVDFNFVGGFDVLSSAEGDNMGFAVSNSTLYSIDLETGAATELGMIEAAADENILGLTATLLPMMPPPPQFVGLTTDNTLLSFGADDPGHVTSIEVTGLEGTLLGIDVRPANGMVYGITTANNIYTIDPDSGEATLASTLSQPFAGGLISGFDFNPVADRLRLVGDNDQNFRINVDTGEVIVDGTLAFGEGDSNEGVNPNVTAAAYTNSVAAPTSTALYNIDPLLDTLLVQNPPNDGTLITVGDLGVDFDIIGGFDVVSAYEGDNRAFAVSDANLYSIDLHTGAAMELGMIGNDAHLDLVSFTALADPISNYAGYTAG